MITIGHLAKVYGLLPSHVEAHATAFDLMVTDVYTAWERHKLDPTEQTQYNTDSLEGILKQARGEQ